MLINLTLGQILTKLIKTTQKKDKVCISEDNLFITCKGFNGGSYMFHTNQGKWWLQKKSTNDEINDLRFAEGCISHTM